MLFYIYPIVPYAAGFLQRSRYLKVYLQTVLRNCPTNFTVQKLFKKISCACGGIILRDKKHQCLDVPKCNLPATLHTGSHLELNETSFVLPPAFSSISWFMKFFISSTTLLNFCGKENEIVHKTRNSQK